MNLMVAVNTNNENPVISENFGRSSWLAVYNTETKTTQFINNTDNAKGDHGVGKQVAATAIDNDIEAIVAIKIGPKAMEILNSENIEVIQAESGMTLAECIELYNNRKK